MSMMGPLWVTIIVLATQVTCSLAASCDLPSPLNSTKASKLVRDYNDAGGNTSCSGVTVLQLIEFALKTTGNTTLTKSKLNWNDTCLDHFNFTLRQVALINGEELNQFPSVNETMDDVHRLLTSNATKAVVQDVNNILKTLRDRNVSLDANLDFFIKDVGFIVKKGTFLSILSYSLKSYNESSTAFLLGYDQRLINATLSQVAEYLLLTQDELQKKFTVECIVRHLQVTKTFIPKLLDYVKEEQDVQWAGKTVTNLVSTVDITILTEIKKMYKGDNLTFFQFFGERKVELVSLDFTVAEMSIASNIQSAVIMNYTIGELFKFVYEHSELLVVYKNSLEASKTMRERILKHYHIAKVSVLEDLYNLTTSQLDQITDVEFENYAIRYYIYRYTREHSNITFEELEAFAKLTPGSLKNATVKDFPELMSNIGVAYAIKALNESGNLKYLLDNHAFEIHMKSLREQIKKDRQPLTTEIVYRDFGVSYLIYLKHLHMKVVYEQTVFNFTNSLLDWDAFVVLFNITDQRQVLRSLFIRYTFKDISRFFGVKEYTIFTWKLNNIITRLLYLNANEINECASGVHDCPKLSKCENYLGGYTCLCPANYNVDPDNKCKDVNECKLLASKNGGCGKGLCINTYGSFECSCPTGYEKDEATGNCVDKNECSSIFDNRCFPNARCINLPGSYECYCNPGYKFNERLSYCQDINECDGAHSCINITNSGCVNTRGSYECRCKSGFNATYNETVIPKVLLSCTDINECGRPELNRCHKNANCTNLNGHYNCSCKEGYEGNGFFCKESRLINPILLRLIYITQTTRVRPFLGFYYGGKVHSEIYISTNGLISIGERYKRSFPKSCKNGRLKKDILAPFWASKVGGIVGYRQIAKEEEDAAPVLKRINEIVDQTTKLTGFEANWALVVAWQKIIPSYCWLFCWFPWMNPYRDETNNFQAVLATNGSTSVVMFLYDDDGMNWHRRLGRKAMVGYATKSGKCEEYEGSFTDSIFDIDDQWFPDPAGTRRKGVIVIVFSKENMPPTPEEQCLSWIKNPPSNNKWMEDLPSCPCTLSAVQSDSRFEYWSAAETSERTCYAYIKSEYTKTCCYFSSGSSRSLGALITNARLAGRVARYSPVSEDVSYREQDEKPFKLCCVDSSKYCGDFSQYRPVEDSCSNQEPEPCTCRWRFGWRRVRRRWRRRSWWQRALRRGWFFGDPHITTLDGFKYSFNGLGDYVLLSTSDKSHVLHGKTVRPLYKDTNKLSNATVFSGFAMRNNKNTTVQVLYNNATPGDLSILVKNSTNACQTFTINDLKSAAGFILKKSNDTLIVMFEDSGFSVEITPGIGLLQISFSVPPALADKNTTGLLGKLNGDKNDDLNYPNGTVLSINSTDKEIFAYGQTWKVQDGDALFMYENCTKLPVFFNGNFLPTFLSDFNKSAIDQSIITKCKNNDQCILDILLTGNEALGLATLVFDEKNDEKRAAMDNLPPDITVTPETINAKVNQTVKINVTAKDPNDGDTVTLSDTGSLPAGATFDNITGVFSWKPLSNQQNQDFKIEFVATDKRGAAQVKTVSVKFCDCKNGQECDFTNILRANLNNSFELVGCNCSERYSGDDCGTENMPCADDPCYGNVSCTPKAAPAYGYTCGPCPAGLVGDGENCNDYDECVNASANNCNVNESCINTVGSYRCQCKPGYKVKTPGGNCTDVDECLPVFGNNDCGANSDCTNTLGSYNCTCKKGYEGNPKKGCTDIDECLQVGRCNHNCENTAGSFNCKCFSGYKLNETSPGNYACTDINECDYLINNDCEQICTNMPSSYTCSCRDGYDLDSNNKTCTAKNPCGKGHDCNQECIVLSGNQCTCQRGHKLSSDNKTCVDINECSSNLHGCAHKCTDAVGNYSCSCFPGYKLMANKRDCEEIDECKTNNGGCEQKCTNTDGSRICSCKRGYQLGNDKMNCEDINECDLGPRCANGQTCKNKKGGYKCRCPAGKFTDGTFACRKSRRFRFKIRLMRYILSVLAWKEELKDEFSDYYISSSRIVTIEINKFFKTKSRFRKKYFGCKVTGFERGSIIADVSLNFDPSSNVTTAALQQEVSNNAAMGDLSYDPKASSVSDENECNDPEENNCDKHATCTNTDGSFTCACKDGYSGSGVECVEKKDRDDTALIIGLSIGLSLLVIIIIIIIVICCYRRNQKGRLPVTEQQGMTSMPKEKSGEVYYGDSNGRRGSDDSIEGQYDIAVATSNYYDNPVMLKDSETPM